MTATSAVRYTVRRWSGLLPLALQAGGAIAAALLLGAWQDRLALNLVAVAVVLGLAVLASDRATLAVRLDASGITWSDRTPRVLISTAGVRRLPWSSVRELEVVEGRLVRARLHAGAPLPGWLSGRVSGPGEPALVVEGGAPGVNGERVRTVLRRVAPDVSFVREWDRSRAGEAESGR
jgi:hypothetical protein